MLWRMRKADARKRAAQRAFRSGRFGLNVYDKGCAFCILNIAYDVVFQS